MVGGMISMRLTILELSITVGINDKPGKNGRIFDETDPYIAAGMGDRTKGECSSYIGEHGINSYKWNYNFFSSNNDSPHRFDASWGLRGGVQFMYVEKSEVYETDFALVWDVLNALLGEENYHKSNFTIDVAYMF